MEGSAPVSKLLWQSGSYCFVHVRVRTCVCMHVCVHACVRVYVRACMCVCVW